MRFKAVLLTYLVLFVLNIQADDFPESAWDTYNVVWNSPSKLASGQMPLGNGDVAAGVYAIEDGDLYLLLSKNDAFNYNGDIIKTGRVRVGIKPNPFAKGKPFRQTLDLKTGSIRIEADGINLRIWADANRSVYHVQVESPKSVSVTAEPELWARYDMRNKKAPDKTQDIRVDRNGQILWYYAVGDRSVYEEEMKYYNVQKIAAKYRDPYRFNTFGNLLESPQLKLSNGVLAGSGSQFDIRIHALSKQTPKVSTWIETIEKQAAQPVDIQKDWQKHAQWWSSFWNRSWIVATDNTLPISEQGKLSGEAPSGDRMDKDGGALVAQSYNVFRYMTACQSRGQVQFKFNGGLFTQPLYFPSNSKKKLSLPTTKLDDGGWLSHEDYRAWGRRFTAQNQRLLYWPMLMSGDTDLMKPFFDFYWDCLPIRVAINKEWFGHEGAYFRENIAPTGGEFDCGQYRKPPKIDPYTIDPTLYKTVPKGVSKDPTHPLRNSNFHSFHFTSGLETVTMMIDLVQYTGDTDFRDNVLVPFAREILLFFDKHYVRDPNGKLRIDPGSVIESWHCAINAAPDVAGLRFNLDALLQMNIGTAADQKNWKRFRAEIPPVPLQEIDGRKALAPADEWSCRKNGENGMLYPIFPFRLYGVGLGNQDIAEWSMKHRTIKQAFRGACWTQDQIQFAYAGDAAEAQAGLIHRYRQASTQCRFPLYGRASPDSCPDLDHFGAGSTALQRMLVQEPVGKIVLFPAWPADWDVDFKLHLEKQTIITGTVKDGKLLRWNITPSSRKKDVVVMDLQ